MKTSEEGIALIKGFEAFRAKAYKDVGGLYTIGYGTVFNPMLSPQYISSGITEERADQLLRNHIAINDLSIPNLIRVPISQNQYDAISSFSYNVGINSFKNSTLLKSINEYWSDSAIFNEFMKWVKVKNTIISGLLLRRKKEAELFFSKSTGNTKFILFSIFVIFMITLYAGLNRNTRSLK